MSFQVTGVALMVLRRPCPHRRRREGLFLERHKRILYLGLVGEQQVATID